MFHGSPSLQWPSTRACGVILQIVVAIGKRMRVAVASTPGTELLDRAGGRGDPRRGSTRSVSLRWASGGNRAPADEAYRFDAHCTRIEYTEWWGGTSSLPTIPGTGGVRTGGPNEQVHTMLQQAC